MSKLYATAPKSIRLQISDDVEHYDLPFPYGEEITWCQDSVSECEVLYVRADIHEALIERVRELWHAVDVLERL